MQKYRGVIVQFFYIKQIKDENGPIKEVTFNYGDSSVAISVVSTGEELLSSHLYLSSERQIQGVAKHIQDNFSKSLEVRAFNRDVVLSKDMIKPKIVGHHNLYGDAPVATNWLEDLGAINSEEEDSLTKVANIGGFGGTLEQGIVSSSVFGKAVLKMQGMGLNPSIDTFVDASDGVAFNVQKSAFPGSLVHPLPIPLDVLNIYDVIFISDHSLAMKNKKESGSDNLQDVYSKMYGIKEVAANAINMLTVPDDKEMDVKMTIQELAGNSKTIFVPQFFGGSESNKKVLELIHEEFPDYVIFSDFVGKIDTEVKYFNLHDVLSSDFQKICAAIKNVDLVLTEPMFVVDIAQAFFKPTIVLDHRNIPVGEYRYYDKVELIQGFDEGFNIEDIKSFKSSCESMKKYLSAFYLEQESQHQETVQENSNSPDQSPNRKKKNLFLQVIGIIATAAFAAFAVYMLGK